MTEFNFRSFRGLARRIMPSSRPIWRVLTDERSGSPVGIETPNATGPDGIWTPIDLTEAELASPSALMLADVNATYRLNVPPYTRYHSTGTDLVPIGSSGTDIVIPPGFNQIFYDELVVSSPYELLVMGEVRVQAWP